jgi:phosphoesterase RecJ-like protein
MNLPVTDSEYPVVPPQELLDALQMSRRPLLVAHISPDGDAIGSITALGYLLYRMGKDPILACQDKAPHTFKYLPFYERITQNFANTNADLMIALDCSDPSRMGSIYDEPQLADLPLMVIDHHITNVFFGDVNWVEPGCCATAEMIFHLAKVLDEPLDEPLATALLTGIVTDTRGFRTSNVTPALMHITGELLDAGAPLAAITERTLDSRTMSMVQLWGRALDTVVLEEGVISASNSLNMRADLGGLIRTEGLVSFILGVDDAHVAAVFTELPDGKVECSFRARPGYNVATVALEFGGGGHPPAAGCTLDGDLATVRSKVLARLKDVARGN